jgi:ATP-dependent DNA helicase RecG
MSTVSPLIRLKGVGPKRAAILEKAGISSLEDLYGYFPRRYLDRRMMKSIDKLENGERVTVVGTVVSVSVERGRRGLARFRAVLQDEGARLELTWFRGVRYFSKVVHQGDALAVHGRVNYFGRQAQMQHPDFDRLNDGGDDAAKNIPGDYEGYHTGKIISLYSTTEAMKDAGLNSRSVRAIMLQAFENYPSSMVEYLSEELISRYGLMPIEQAYREIHFPTSSERLEKARYRMKWGELFFAQLLFALRRSQVEHEKTSVKFDHSGMMTAKLHETIPFELTAAQKNAVREIYRDLRSGRQMNRLLQGDVGSGKTLVAMFSMALAADNGLQAAFMAPTEILAFQHYLGMKRSLQPIGLRIGLLTGKQGKKERCLILNQLEAGQIDILVGTHAVLEGKVNFRNLGLVIIDEQHRFGVMQRKALQEKGVTPHVLLMTATPIPRTLAMGVYGDLDVTVIDQIPAGRQPVETRVCQAQSKAGIYNFLRTEVGKGRQAFIVYPLVEESEKLDLEAATESYHHLKENVFPELRVGLIHGQQSAAEKEAVMEMFRGGDIDILVGTTVIEVGVDVPNATVMAIEHAERFGIAQLHQLRGRVGRGCHRSSCFLVYSKLTADARERLQAVVSTTNGFRLSEIDAKLRGAGNLLGKEQSGTVNGMKIADMLTDYEIMESARGAAVNLVASDRMLSLPQHAMIRKHYLKHYHERFTLADIG